MRKWRAKRARSNATCFASTTDKLSLRRSRLDFGIAGTECRQSRQPRMGRWGDGEMGRWEDGKMGRWEDGKMGSIVAASFQAPCQRNKARIFLGLRSLGEVGSPLQKTKRSTGPVVLWCRAGARRSGVMVIKKSEIGYQPSSIVYSSHGESIGFV